MKRLTATFALAADRIKLIRAEHERRIDEELAVTVFPRADGADVVGRAQDVMFLIGEIAAQGEDALIRVH